MIHLHEWFALVGLVKVAHDEEGFPIRTVPLGAVVTMLVFLVSAIGAQQTIIWTAQHERSALARAMSDDTEKKIALSTALTIEKLGALESRLKIVEERQRINEEHIMTNTGWIQAQKERGR